MKDKFSKWLLLASVTLLMAAGCNRTPTSDLRPPTTETRQQIQVVQKVESDFSDSLFNFYADENKTALDLLKTGHKVGTKEFADIGEFVESINTVKPDKKHFWEFFVNGKPSSVGAGSYKPKDKDKLEWKLSEIK